MRAFFMMTNRIGFSKWTKDDPALAELLWGDADVTRFICAAGRFSQRDIQDRLNLEVRNDAFHHVQYWPIFDRKTSELIGCCGLRPCEREAAAYEIGFHLRKKFWGRGLASEAARAVIDHAFSTLHANELRAGHHPENAASRKLLSNLGFRYVRDEYYAPTGLNHPSYRLVK